MNKLSLLIASLTLSVVSGCQGTTPVSELSPASQTAADTFNPELWPAVTSTVSKDAEIEARIDAIMGTMSIKEKIGQVVQPELRHVTPKDVRDYHLGSILNGGGSYPDGNKYASLEDWVAKADGFWHASMDTSDGNVAIPIMWGTDAVHGLGNVVGATLFPHNIGLGAAHDPELLKRIGWATAREIAATGIDWDFSPTVAVARDDRWGRTYESWSEGPEIVSDYAGEMVTGLQGKPGSKDFLDDYRVIATAKHFVGDGGTLNGTDRGKTQGDERVLAEIHGAGYKTAIEAGVQAVMASFSSWQGVPMHGHQYLLTTVLKERMGFDGLVVGDWNGHMYIAGCTTTDCPESIMAGLDIYMAPDPDWKKLYNNLVAQAKSGEITEARLNDAVRRILRVKLRAGLFERGAPSTRPLAAKPNVVGAPEHRAIAREAVQKSLVLLKNNDQLLPLMPNQTVLVAGDGADNMGKQSGGWSVTWQGTGNKNSDFPGGTSIYAGINAVVTSAGGKTILSENGDYKTKPDVAIVVFGEDPYAEMQGDVPDLTYKPRDDSDRELLKKLQADGIPVVSVFLSGRPMWVNRELNASDAFVAAWLPGSEGQGIADVIFKKAGGEINVPMTGRLSFSWPKHPLQTPLNKGDAQYDPLFAYGYGLRYGEESKVPDDLSEKGLEKMAVTDELVLFNQRAVEPWELGIKDHLNTYKAMTSKQIDTASIAMVAVDRNVQEDARRVTWNGKGEGDLMLSVPQRQDFTDYVNAKSALVFDVAVHQAPTKDAFIRLSCGTYCASDLDITKALTKINGDGWQTITVPLSCFPDSGGNFGVIQPPKEYWAQVTAPFGVATKGKLDITFADVKIVKGAGKGVDCP